MKAFVDLQMALAAAELAFQHPHWDVIESAMKKFEDLRNGGFDELSEDEENIAEQADREIYRLYQDKEMERRATSPNVLEQHDLGNARVDHGANEGEDLRPKPTVALGARPKERQRSPPSGNQQEYEWPREDQGHAPKEPDWSDQYEPRCESPRDRRFHAPEREEGPRTSHYHPRNSAYLEPKLEYPRSRNIDYIAQEPEYEAHEEFGYKELKNEAGMEVHTKNYASTYRQSHSTAHPNQIARRNRKYGIWLTSRENPNIGSMKMPGTHDNGTRKKENNLGTLTVIHGGIYKPKYLLSAGTPGGTQRTRHGGRYTTRRSSTASLRRQPGLSRIFL